MENPTVSKKEYSPPELKTWGTIADLTQAGGILPGADAKCGSGGLLGA